MDFGLTGRKVFVTGGSAGIGRAMVKAFAAEGAKVAFTFNSNAEAATALANEIGGHAIRMDIRDHAAVRTAVEAAMELLGQIDVLVNNALAKRSALGNVVGLEQWQLSLRSNLEGPYLITQLVAPDMAERGWGRIVTVSSDLAENGAKGSTAYSASKAGLHGMTRGLCWELGPHNVLINVIMPGLTSTENQLAAVSADNFERIAKGNPTGRTSDAEDIADLAVFLCSARNRNITGEFIRVTGGS